MFFNAGLHLGFVLSTLAISAAKKTLRARVGVVLCVSNALNLLSKN